MEPYTNLPQPGLNTATAHCIFAKLLSVFIVGCQLVYCQQPCGLGCECSDSKIWCHNTTSFPAFNDTTKSETTSVSIVSSCIGNLPLFSDEEWPELKFLELWNNTNMTCSYVTQIRRSGLKISTECDDPNLSEWYTFFPLNIIGLVVCVFVYGFYRYRKQARCEWQGLYKGSFNREHSFGEEHPNRQHATARRNSFSSGCHSSL